MEAKDAEAKNAEAKNAEAKDAEAKNAEAKDAEAKNDLTDSQYISILLADAVAHSILLLFASGAYFLRFSAIFYWTHGSLEFPTRTCHIETVGNRFSFSIISLFVSHIFWISFVWN